MLPTFHEQFFDELMRKRRQLLPELENMDDFYMELKWEFKCSVPGITYLLPSDLCKIRKRGSSIRMDSTLAGIEFEKLRYKRRNISFLFDSSSSPNPTLFFINNEKKYYEKSDFQLPDKDGTWSQADAMIHQDIKHVTMSRSCITFKKCIDWWRFDRTIGRFMAQYYEVCGMVVKYRQRKEHLSKQQIKENKAEVSSVKRMIWETIKGNISFKEDDSDVSEDEDDEVQPVPPCTVTWEQYINSKPGMHPTLARPIILKEKLVHVKTTIGMSKQLRLPVDKFVKILEVIAPFKHFDKLREFMQMKLPEGFPVKLEIPIVPTISARITFPEFQYCSESGAEPFPDHLFRVPQDYKNKSG